MSLQFGKSLMRVLVLLTLLMLLGCGQTPLPTQSPEATSEPSPVANDPLDNTAWILQSLYGRAPLEDTSITLNFSEGFGYGEAGCNPYFNGDETMKYKISAHGALKIYFVNAVRLCPSPPGIMEQEKTYLDALHSVARYTLREDRLELKDESGDIILVFTKWHFV
jgi:heat shock protein HslJ